MEDEKPIIIKNEKGNIIEMKFYVNDTLHRIDKPAIILYNPDSVLPKVIETRYYFNNKLHRDNGPAIMKFDPNSTYEMPRVTEIQYYRNGLLHQEYGPAIIKYDKSQNAKEVSNYKNGIHQQTDFFQHF